MTEYEKLVFAEKHTLITDFMANVEVKATGEQGVAYTLPNNMAAVFYGADDGSDDKTVTADEFNRDFKVIGDFGNQRRKVNDNDILTISIPVECANIVALSWILDSWGELFKKALSCKRTDFYIENSDTGTVIVFPWWEEDFSTTRMISYYGLFLMKLCQWSNQTNISIYAPTTDDDLYEFRNLLFALGYVGDEWKAERRILCQDLVAEQERKSKRE